MVTTASLEAYQSYARGIDMFSRERRAEARPHFQRAHEIDPDVAMAYWAHTVVTADPGERVALRTEAYQRRQSASMGERLIIEFDYVREVERDLEKARQLGEETLQIAPNTPPVLNDLALLYRELGNLRRATALHERFLQVAPGALSHSNLGVSSRSTCVAPCPNVDHASARLEASPRRRLSSFPDGRPDLGSVHRERKLAESEPQYAPIEGSGQ